MISMPKAAFDAIHTLVTQLSQGLDQLKQGVEQEAKGGACPLLLRPTLPLRLPLWRLRPAKRMTRISSKDLPKREIEVKASHVCLADIRRGCRNSWND